jgi:hypothetical protein
MKRVAILGASIFFVIRAATAWAAIPQPLTPSGPITGPLPTLKWTSIGVPSYLVEIKSDLPFTYLYGVYEPKLNMHGLGLGIYRWRVKDGDIFEQRPWSPRLTFTIFPKVPIPSVPISRLLPVPTAPVFQWFCYESQVNLFTIQLFRDEDLLNTLSVTGQVVMPITVKFQTVWPAALPAGTYRWRIKALRKRDDPAATLKSDWSPFCHFTVGVPGQPGIIKPSETVSLSPGFSVIDLEWTKPEGNGSFAVKVLRNGEELIRWPDTTTNKMAVLRDWDPGHYALMVQPSNFYGSGAWSQPRSFLIRRRMTPGAEHFALVFPNRLVWTRSAAATRYGVALHRANPVTGNYELVKKGSVNQTANPPFWKPGVSASGAYRWTVTDFEGDKPGYTSIDYFSIDVPTRPEAELAIGHVRGLAGVEFAWRAPVGPATHYQFQLLKNGALIKNSGWIKAATLTKGPDILSLTYSLAPSGAGLYHWRVRAKNAAGAGGWRVTKVKCEELPAPVFIQPADHSSHPAGSLLSIQWKPVFTASRYQLQIRRNDILYEVSVLPSGSATESYDWSIGGGVWTVRVRAVGDGFGPWTTRTVTGN